MPKKYNILYRTTNLITGKSYIGRHCTDNLSDGYLGSGSALKKSIIKHGKNNFTREVLHLASSKSDLIELEEFIVDCEYVSSKDTYNCRVGGNGPLDNYLGVSKSNSTRTVTKQFIRKMSELKSGRNNHMFGKRHKKSTIEKMSSKKALHNHWNSKPVEDLETGDIFNCLKKACSELNLKYVTENMRMQRNSSTVRFKYI